MRTRRIALAAISVTLLAACGGAPSPTARPTTFDPDPTPPPAGATDGGLAGTSWVGTTADPSSPADPARITLRFEATTLSASGGCNRMGGDYQVVGGVLATGPMMTTEMACAEPLMAQDQWLATLLGGATVSGAGTTLTLANGGTTLTLADEQAARPDAALEGTLWTLDAISDGSTSASVPAGVTASIRIQDGRADVSFGCNSGGGDVTVGETTLTFGVMATTLMLCEGPAGAVETAMTGVLHDEVPYAIDGDTLTLTGANGTALVFRATAA
jgi:heat shock protein HslJ